MTDHLNDTDTVGRKVMVWLCKPVARESVKTYLDENGKQREVYDDMIAYDLYGEYKIAALMALLRLTNSSHSEWGAVLSTRTIEVYNVDGMGFIPF
jgi:hypothetical protein